MEKLVTLLTDDNRKELLDKMTYDPQTWGQIRGSLPRWNLQGLFEALQILKCEGIIESCGLMIWRKIYKENL
jgi:hypothetical protein